jgi:hypothetical protein
VRGIHFVAAAVVLVGCAAALVVACGSSPEQACQNMQSSACHKAFQCEPDSGLAQLVGTESNCAAVAQQACTSTATCTNPPCCTIFEPDGGTRLGTFNADYASACANAVNAASCDQLLQNTYDPTSACSKVCQ